MTAQRADGTADAGSIDRGLSGLTPTSASPSAPTPGTPRRTDVGASDAASAGASVASVAASAERRAWRPPVWAIVPLVATGVALFFITGGTPPRMSFVQWYCWAALVGPIVWVDRKLPVRRDALGARAALHVPLSFVFALAYVLLSQSVHAIIEGVPLTSLSLARIVELTRRGSIHWSVLYYWLIVGAHFAIGYHRESRERERRTTELERLLVEAQLSALRAQLHPHFLFNALNTISAEVERQPHVARRMLEHLGELLRLSLERARPDQVTLTDELEMLEHYLAIQRTRFAGRLEIAFDIDPAARDALVPGLLLQPLVENAIRHGLAPRARPGHIRIAARTSSSHLHVTVEDDGVGLPAGWTLDRQAGIGLANTRERLEAQYGARHTFTVSPAAGGGTIVAIDVPLTTADTETTTTAIPDRSARARGPAR